MTCVVCGRSARGYAYQEPSNPLAPKLAACSMRCLEIIYRNGKVGFVFNLNHYENQAVDAASDEAGAYLEEIGKTDLATLTPDEWRNLISLVLVKATAEIQRLTDEKAVPF